MPQENQVLRCFSCETFQVHLIKKVQKWECKLCGVKQSFKRHYGRGSGKDCRNHVMKLNELRITKADSENPVEGEIAEDTSQETAPIPAEEKKGSKWAKYLDDDNENEQETFYKPERKRKISEDFDDIIKASKESEKRLINSLSNNTQNIENSKQQSNTTERKKSKNIFDSDLDNPDFLSFI